MTANNAVNAAGPRVPAAPGDTFTLRKDPVTTRQLVMYAGASGDFNRIHYDQDYAREAGLGGVIAHGMLTMGFAAQAVTDWAGPGATVVAMSGRFLSPVKPGDAPVMTVTVRDIGRCPAGRTVADLDVAATVGTADVFSGTARVRLPG